MDFNFLQKNDVVDIISPATACDFNEITKIKEFVKKIGLKPNIFLEKETTLKTTKDHEFPSFSSEIRFQQFKKAILSDSKIIWCSRGGYGSSEIVPFLDKLPKPKKQKIFIGFSDIASLNKILIEKWNWQIIAAPMLVQIALDKVSKKSIQTIVNLIFGKIPELKYELEALIPTKTNIKTKITGGCISVLAGQFGTKNQINWQNKILFLEDEGEDGERLDRYFTQILNIILKEKKYPKAILLGNFLESNPHGTPKEKNIKLAIARFIENLQDQKIKIPLFIENSNSLGHSKNMMPLFLGKESKIINNFLTQN